MKLRHMEVFHAIMRTGSVTGAARILNVTQPAVSTMLKNCERQLQLKLFERIGGRLQPTPEAEAIFPDVSAIFARLDDVARLTEDLLGGRIGTLTVAASMAIANGQIPKAIASFIANRPQVQVEVIALTSPRVQEAVMNGEAELGISFAPVTNVTLETEVLLRSHLTCALSEDHVLAKREVIDVADLAPYPIISYLPQAMLRPVIEEVLAGAGIAPSLSAQVNLSLVAIMIARWSQSVALVEPNLLNTIRIPSVVARPLRPATPLTMVLVRQKSAPVSAITSQFVAHLKRTVGEEEGHQPTL
ncbi:LysR family transcriptional regulator [Chelatococcus sp. GCM10030263]|uniref:LysR family transcriptional regulator n=1 Tax=Chelatococcus sp. GCM10030263 TaxID=3273387 RepID=UPI003610FB2F